MIAPAPAPVPAAPAPAPAPTAAPATASGPAPAAPAAPAPAGKPATPASRSRAAAPAVAAPSPETPRRAVKKFGVIRGPNVEAQKVVIYGPGGVGKTELCSLLTQVGIVPLYVDLEGSSSFLDVARLDPPPETFEDVRDALHTDFGAFGEIGAVVIDSLTKLEELDRDFVCRTIPHEKGNPIRSIEDFGWGKGYMHIYEQMLLVLQDLDAIARGGRHVVCVCHEQTEKVPNPSGEDFLQYQPRLQSPPKQGKLRERVLEWCDHLFYVAFDRFVDQEGKAKGNGTRTIHVTAMPTHWAKSRCLDTAIQYDRGDAKLWGQLFT